MPTTYGRYADGPSQYANSAETGYASVAGDRRALQQPCYSNGSVHGSQCESVGYAQPNAAASAAHDQNCACATCDTQRTFHSLLRDDAQPLQRRSPKVAATVGGQRPKLRLLKYSQQPVAAQSMPSWNNDVDEPLSSDMPGDHRGSLDDVPAAPALARSRPRKVAPDAGPGWNTDVDASSFAAEESKPVAPRRRPPRQPEKRPSARDLGPGWNTEVDVAPEQPIEQPRAPSTSSQRAPRPRAEQQASRQQPGWNSDAEPATREESADPPVRARRPAPVKQVERRDGSAAQAAAERQPVRATGAAANQRQAPPRSDSPPLPAQRSAAANQRQAPPRSDSPPLPAQRAPLKQANPASAGRSASSRAAPTAATDDAFASGEVDVSAPQRQGASGQTDQRDCPQCGRNFAGRAFVMHIKQCSAASKRGTARNQPPTSAAERPQSPAAPQAVHHRPSAAPVEELPLNTGGYALPPEAFADDANEEPLEPCPHCSRSFRVKALDRHMKICVKVFQEKRKGFDVNAHILPPEAQKAKQAHEKQEKKAAPRGQKAAKTAQPTPQTQAAQPAAEQPCDWKKKSEAFRDAMKQGRLIKKFEKEGRSLRDLPPPKATPAELDDRQPCPHCKRRFGQQQAERHIPACAKSMAMKKKPGR